jgi:hypothetical protein
MLARSWFDRSGCAMCKETFEETGEPALVLGFDGETKADRLD